MAKDKLPVRQPGTNIGKQPETNPPVRAIMVPAPPPRSR